MNIKKMTLGGGLAAAVLAGSLLMSGGAAYALSGTGYDNTDPSTTGCAATATTIASFPITTPSGTSAGTMNVRYSSGCQTNWVQSTSTLSSAYYVQKVIYRGAQGSLPVGGNNTTDAGSGTSYGNQVYAPGATCISVRTDITVAANSVAPNGVVATTGNKVIC